MISLLFGTVEHGFQILRVDVKTRPLEFASPTSEVQVAFEEHFFACLTEELKARQQLEEMERMRKDQAEQVASSSSSSSSSPSSSSVASTGIAGVGASAAGSGGVASGGGSEAGFATLRQKIMSTLRRKDAAAAAVAIRRSDEDLGVIAERKASSSAGSASPSPYRTRRCRTVVSMSIRRREKSLA
jgi:hypothetical protein